MRRDEQGDKARRATIRDLMVAQGLSHPDDVAARLLREWPSLTPIGAYRLAHEMSQPMVADRYNRLTGRQPFESGWMTRREVSRLELWPHHGDARRPTAGDLVILAQVLGASSPTRLVDAQNWSLLDPADQAALLQHTSSHTRTAGADTTSVPYPGAEFRPPAGITVHAAHLPSPPEPVRVGADHGPPSVERLITMTARESASYGDRPSNIGKFTLDQFRADATRLARLFPTAPRLELLTELRWQRDQVFQVLETGRQPVDQTRQLYFLAAATCGMLAEVTEQLGYREPAMSHARTAWLCAKEADHHPLMAWILQNQGLITLWGGQPEKAAEYVTQGQELDVRGSVAVWLPNLEARARGAMGDTEGTHAALNRAREARESVQADDLDEIGGIFRYSEAKQFVHAGHALVTLGDGSAAQPMSQAGIDAYTRGLREERALDVETGAHLDIAMAHILTGDLDGATEAASRGLDIPQHLRGDDHAIRARQLHRAVSKPEHHGSAGAGSLRERIEEFLAAPAQTLPTS